MSLKKDPQTVQSRLDEMKPEKVEADRVETNPNQNEPRTARKETKSWDEPGSVKTKGQSETVESNSDSKSSAAREQVMLEFMDSMESEFGIPPQDLVVAMTQIPEGDQLKSPEASASQVIAQLKLPEDQEQKALALYVGMLSQLQQMQQQPAMKPAMFAATAASAAAAPVVMNSQQRKALLNDSLDRMNQKFFMQGAAQPPAVEKWIDSKTPENAQTLPADPLGTFPKDQVSIGQMAYKDQMASIDPQKGFLKSPFPVDQGSGIERPPLPEGMEQIDPNSQEGQQLLKSLVALGAAATALDQGLKADPQNAQALKAEQMMNGLNPSALPPLEGMANFGFGGMTDEEDLSGFGKESSPDQFFVHHNPAHAAHATRAEAANGDSFGAMVAGTAGAVGADKLNPAENEANIQALMKQAQYLIKKGGGESKIQAAPEGIGQIHMKVVVNEGKVNLEMSAESKEAKKLIESSIGELKSNLAQHRLGVEHVKVDVGNGFSSDNKNSEAQNQQRQMDMNQQQSKNQTRDFWSEYSQNGGFDRRGTFQESPGVRAYKAPSAGGPNVEALTPANSGSVGQKRYQGSGKGRGLNLVA
ncbi:MAG: flagellar hook-length control protein FliK [Pseudobdellovibrionaceae bacterium]